MKNNDYDLIIIGAGILGAACALTVKQQKPGLKMLVLEKELAAAQHQTGRNSGVIHAGVYYPPGSLKAKFCREGLEQTIAFCQQQNLPYLQCGKLIVATNDAEESRLQVLNKRCQQNDLEPIWMDEAQIRKKEPNIRGQAGILVKHTGITDYTAVTKRLLGLFETLGGQVLFGHDLLAFEDSSKGLKVLTNKGQFQTQQLLNCAGLHADRIARKVNLQINTRILPFRGEYFRLPSKFNNVVQHLIYPVPDPTLPFLGVHLTRMIDGSVTVGPNAVLAFAREGYTKFKISLKDTLSTLSYAGFWRLLSKYPSSSIRELKNSIFRMGYLEQVQKYCPDIGLEDLLPYPSGVRAQAVNLKGELCHDFEFAQDARSLHVVNAPSPAATSALPIAKHIATKLVDRF